ncbi:polysaccharide deacetylase family protein [Candidatus Daviesbacteria bacterium]|nr:polysaccharide deacetylase family protein [Candidatus Daviesbacteria bacterium]
MARELLEFSFTFILFKMKLFIFGLLGLLTLLGVLISPVKTEAGVKLSVPILMYHYIGNNPNPKDYARNTLSVAPDKFETQMQYLASHGYTPISLDTLYGIYNGQVAALPKPIVLTFDDGYIDFYTTAWPILSRFGFHAVSFIPTGLMNQGYYMSWAMIRQIAASGLVTFEGHSISHSSLTGLNNDRLIAELKDSKNMLQSQTGYPVNFVAYPNGATNGYVQSVARRLGYVGGLGTWYSKASGPSMNLPRIRITGQMSLTDFASRI